MKRSEDAYEYGGPWSKESPICRRQAMKIITPCYPQANTTSKVSGLQLLAIKTELFRGLAITQSIVDAKGSVPIEQALDRLLSPFSFFERYTHFVMVTASAETKVFPRFQENRKPISSSVSTSFLFTTLFEFFSRFPSFSHSS